jgi:hypothetical protein
MLLHSIWELRWEFYLAAVLSCLQQFHALASADIFVSRDDPTIKYKFLGGQTFLEKPENPVAAVSITINFSVV